THFDHAVDAPAIARRYGCPACGGSSLVALMRLHGLAGQAVEVEPHQSYELGPFVVRFVPSRHSKLILGRKVPFDGPLTCEDLGGLRPGAYRCGEVWGRQVTPRYWERVLPKLDPMMVVPTHYDNFFQPLGEQ